MKADNKADLESKQREALALASEKLEAERLQRAKDTESTLITWRAANGREISVSTPNTPISHDWLRDTSARIFGHIAATNKAK